MKRLGSLRVGLKASIFLGLCSMHVNGILVSPSHGRRSSARRSFSVLNAARTSSEEDSSFEYDLAVVGGGVVGVQAALAAASAPYSRRVCLIDAPREAGVLMAGEEDLSIGAPTGLFGKALRDTSKRIKVSTLRGMGLREDR